VYWDVQVLAAANVSAAAVEEGYFADAPAAAVEEIAFADASAAAAEAVAGLAAHGLCPPAPPMALPDVRNVAGLNARPVVAVAASNSPVCVVAVASNTPVAVAPAAAADAEGAE
jgi:ABC-type nitrate/sulfonate/bicarbonate transport system substrate-binding protein